MKYKYILLFIFLINSNSQINSQSLIGDWTKVKIRTLDGSKDLSEKYNSFSNYYNWKINATKICMSIEPIEEKPNNCFDYKLEKNLIVTSPDSGYKIEKLTNDSLVVFENIKGKIEKDKILKIWFVRSSKIIDENIKKTINDSVLIASPYFTPTQNKSFVFDISKDFMKKNNFPTFLFKGKLIIYPKDKKIEFETENKKIINDKNFQIVKSYAEKSFENWNLTLFQNFNKIYIPFIFESKFEMLKEGRYIKGVRIYYFMNNPNDIPKVYGPKMENLESAQQKLEKAVSYLKDKNYNKAVEFFNKGYELNPSKVDALYNIVSIYSFLKDKENMCLTLKKLKDLEQTDGTKLYNSHCVKE